MARPLRPLISSGGYYPSRRWIPLVRGNGYTTQDGGEEEPGIWKTIKGALIHLTDALASPMQKCEVTLEPIQDLHGQDAPYPAGGGKNKADVSKITGTYISVSNDVITITSASGSGVSTSVTFASIVPSLQVGDTCVLSYETTGTAEDHIWLRSGNVGGRWDNGDSRILTEDDLNSTFKFYGTGTIIKFQVELGTSSTAYSPYSNICPITGWTGCEVTRTGQNIVSKTVNCYFYSNATHPVMDNNSESAVFYAIRGTTYVRSSNPSPTRSTIALADSDEITYNTNLTNAHTMSLEDNNTWVAEWTGWTLWYFYPNYSASVEETAQIEVGSTATDYEEPNITTLSVTFPDSAGTVYGGTVDLVSGVLVVDRASFVFDGTQPGIGANWQTKENSTAWWYQYQLTNHKFPSVLDTVPTFLASSCPVVTPREIINGTNPTLLEVSCYNSTSIGIIFRTTDMTLTTAAAVNAYLAVNPVQLVYELAEPIEIQLTPQEISTLKGENNVWSNGDSVEITYKAQAE